MAEWHYSGGSIPNKIGKKNTLHLWCLDCTVRTTMDSQSVDQKRRSLAKRRNLNSIVGKRGTEVIAEMLLSAILTKVVVPWTANWSFARETLRQTSN